MSVAPSRSGSSPPPARGPPSARGPTSIRAPGASSAIRSAVSWMASTPVVEDVDLPHLPVHLPPHGLRQDLIAPRQHVGDHREAVPGRGLDAGSGSGVREGELEGPWDGGGGEGPKGEDVHRAPEGCFSRSLCFTPNRCSSSTTRSPRSLKRMSGERSRWVPTPAPPTLPTPPHNPHPPIPKMSTSPSAQGRTRMSRHPLGGEERKRDTASGAKSSPGA